VSAVLPEVYLAGSGQLIAALSGCLLQPESAPEEVLPVVWRYKESLILK